MTYRFLVLRRCLNGEIKTMYCKDGSIARRVFIELSQLKSDWVEMLELTDAGVARRMFNGGDE